MRQTILDHLPFGLFTAALPDILGSVGIGMRLPSARATPKLRLMTSVALLTVATECQLSEGLVMPRLLANPIAGRIRSLEGTAPSVRVGRRDLDCDPQSRNQSIGEDQLQVNRLKGGGIIPGI
jgi:hypothetical protein